MKDSITKAFLSLTNPTGATGLPGAVARATTRLAARSARVARPRYSFASHVQQWVRGARANDLRIGWGPSADSVRTMCDATVTGKGTGCGQDAREARTPSAADAHSM